MQVVYSVSSGIKRNTISLFSLFLFLLWHLASVSNQGIQDVRRKTITWVWFLMCTPVHPDSDPNTQDAPAHTYPPY